MKKETQTRLMHQQRFGERERFADKASQPLPQRIIPTFHMSGFTCFLSHSGVLLFWKDRLIGRPEIREAMPLTVGGWNGLPQATTRPFTSISDRVGDYLPRLAAQRNPDPRLIGLFQHKRPELIQFQDRRSRISAIWCDHGLA